MHPRILHLIGICLIAGSLLNAQALEVAYAGPNVQSEITEKKVRLFLEKFTPHAINITKQYGIPAELTLAVGALESGWGTSHLAEFANNYFGIKARNPQEPVYLYTTREYSNGHYVLATTSFRRYYLPEGSFWAFARKLRLDERYQRLWDIPTHDLPAWVYGLTDCGYATDPYYSEKLLRIIRDNQLQSWVRAYSHR